MKCPKCGDDCWRDSCDVGVGVIYGPYGCPCGWSEDRELDRTSGGHGNQTPGWWTDQYGVSYSIDRVVENCERFGLDGSVVRRVMEGRKDEAARNAKGGADAE